VNPKKTPSFDLELFLSSVDGGRTLSRYREGEIVFTQGDPANAVFYVREGECKVSVVSEQGKEAVVAIHGKGDFFGEGCLNGQLKRLATVAALTQCEIMRLDKAAMLRVLREEPSWWPDEAWLTDSLPRIAPIGLTTDLASFG
jgi:CRP/FNR family cyclic AMP-dependent transcriptional regulator